ncbi:hypothetical protein [Aureimonas sp. N4]|uniref:hypothetical protein n=1 Tax=Aureimonas sp. N4 TaxID=1638165 RepID=UPI0012E3EC97|nr:hypothetical protein [Aureimonas sp. N4]
MTEPWNTERFLRWQKSEEALHELVGGFPLKLPKGVTRRQDRMVVDLIGWLSSALRGTPFSPFTRRFGMETRPGQIRRPAVGVDGGAGNHPEALVASAPIAVFEFLCDPLHDFDRLRKIADYKRAPFLRHIVFLCEDRPLAFHGSRLAGAGWDDERVEGMDASIPLAALGISLPLRALYEAALA